MTAPASHTPRAEMFWRPDPQVDAARRLPEWGAFHQICGRMGLCFDHIERESRRGLYVCDAMRVERLSGGGYQLRLLHQGRGDVLSALGAAYAGSGIVVPGATELLERGLCGGMRHPAEEIVPPVAVSPADPFEDLFG